MHLRPSCFTFKGGELFDRIVEAGHFTESQAAIVGHPIESISRSNQMKE